MSKVAQQVEQIVAPFLAEHQVELVDLTYQKEHAGWTLRFYLDKPGGITLDDCQQWSNRIEAILDREDLIPNSYVLEVSSPGIERPLKRTVDFQRFVGQRVTVRLFAPLNGQKNFHGTLQGADEQVIRLDDESNGPVALPRPQIAKAHLDPVIVFD